MTKNTLGLTLVHGITIPDVNNLKDLDKSDQFKILNSYFYLLYNINFVILGYHKVILK